MGRTVRNSKGKTMRPNFFVFCEGKIPTFPERFFIIFA